MPVIAAIISRRAPFLGPTADGSNGQALVTNGAGVLSWLSFEASGATNAAIAAHLAAGDPHAQYLTEAEGDARYALLGSGVTDHGALTGLGDDDHSIYALLAGRAGGQSLVGGTASGEKLILRSTSHATHGVFGLEGATSAFPALKRSGADLHFRLADDSNFCTVRAFAYLAPHTSFFGGLAFPSNNTNLRRHDGAEAFSINVTTGIANSVFGFGLGANYFTPDIFLMRAAAAQLQLGQSSSTPIDQLLKGPDGSGTNIGGGDLKVAAGRSTGNAAGGDLILQVTVPGSSGASLNALVTKLTVRGADGLIVLDVPTSNPSVAGALWNDGGTLKVSAG